MSIFRKYLLLSLTFALLNAAVLLIFFVPRFDHSDTQQYVSSVKYFAGDPEGEIFLHRILKPLPILIGVALAPILGAENVFIFQNLIFYFLSVWLIFLLVHRIYQNEKQAFYGTVLYSAAYPMLAYGLASLTDLPGWFFYLLSILIVLNLLKKPRLEIALLTGFIVGFGMLFKENLAAASIFFVSFVVIATQISINEKLRYILLFGAAFIILPLINSLILYKLYSYSYLDWYTSQFNHPRAGFFAYSPLRITIEIIRVFLIGWLFVYFGIIKEFVLKNIARIKVLVALLPSSLSFFLWAFPHNRIAYIAFPLLVLLGSFGLLRNYKNPKINTFVEVSLLSLYIFLNYALLEFLLRYGPVIQPPGTIFG